MIVTYSDVKTTFDPDMGWGIETNKLFPSSICNDSILEYYDGCLLQPVSMDLTKYGKSLVKKITTECNISYTIQIEDFNVYLDGSYLPNGEQS